jgi:tRNA(Ile)-lysidine synthase
MSADVLDAVRATGLLGPQRPVVVLLSGGRDSVCLLDVAVRLGGSVRALHVNYGLRDEADADEALCAALCSRLGTELEVRRPRRAPVGNLQAWAREERYAAATALAVRHDADVAAGHTATDQVESVLYRLAASPGRRALLGMREREGRLVRPLLGLTRARTGAHCAARGLPFADDATNAGAAFARGRVRHGLVPALRAVHPAAEANVLRTLEVLRDEAEVLDAAVGELLDGDAVTLDALAAAPPALARLALQRLADAAWWREREGGGDVPGGRPAAAPGGRPAAAPGGRPAAAPGGRPAAAPPAVGRHLPTVLAQRGAGGNREIHLGGGLRAAISYGVLRVAPVEAGPAAPEAAVLPLPGRVAFAGGELIARCGPDLPVADGTLDAAALGRALRIRAWRAGDRMRPLGGGGSKSLQDLFTDRRIPRERRGLVPVVEAAGEIAWVPGVATSERFKVTTSTRERVQVTWQAPGPNYP